MTYSRFNLLALLCFSFSIAWSQLPRESELLSQLDSATTHDEKARLLSDLVAATQVFDVPKAKKYAKQAIDLARKHDLKFYEGWTLSRHGMNFYYEGNYDSAIYFLELSKPIFEELDSTKFILYYYINMAIVISSKGNNSRGLEYFFNALEMAESMNNERIMASCHHNIAWLYGPEGMLDKALEHYKKALELNLKLNFPMSASRNLEGIGIIHNEKGEWREAIGYFKQCIAQAELANQTSLIRGAYNEIGYSYQQLNQIDSARYYYQESLKYMDEKSPSNGLVLLLSNLATLNFKLATENPDLIEEGVKYARKAYDIAYRIGAPDKLMEAHRLMITVDSLEGNFLSALKHYQIYDSIKTSLKDEKQREKIAELDSKFELASKEQRISNLEQQNQLAETRKNLLIVSIILVVIIGLLLLNQQRIRIRKNRLLLEKEQEVDRMKSRFFANISHEFRTPLTLILGPVQEIVEQSDNKVVQHHMGVVKRNAMRLLQLVNQILELSKLQTGKRPLRLVKTDMAQFISRVTHSFQSLADSNKIELVVALEKDQHIGLFDHDVLEKIVTNLLSNAFKFTPEGGCITVKLSGNNEEAVIQVEDTGIGIDNKVLQQIFEDFYHTESKLQPSTGIGLSLTKELIENHGGTINVESQPQKGSVFTVVIPLTEEQFQQKNIQFIIEQLNVNDTPIEASYVPLEGPEGGVEVEDEREVHERKVLYIEDNEEIRDYVKEVLAQQYQVILAANGIDGIAIAKEHIPDLIITDVMMPEMDGHEVMGKLKEDPLTCHIPVIMLTAKSDQDSKLEGLQSKADAYIPKPFDKDELLIQIENLISSRESLHEYYKNKLLEPKQESAPSMNQIFLNKVITQIENNISNNGLSVEILAGEVGLSRSQLHRKVIAITGQSVGKLIRDIRLKRAADLLSQQVGTVSEIGYMTGFSSPSYFNKCFKDHFGHAPGELMKGNELRV